MPAQDLLQTEEIPCESQQPSALWLHYIMFQDVMPIHNIAITFLAETWRWHNNNYGQSNCFFSSVSCLLGEETTEMNMGASQS